MASSGYPQRQQAWYPQPDYYSGGYGVPSFYTQNPFRWDMGWDNGGWDYESGWDDWGNDWGGEYPDANPPAYQQFEGGTQTAPVTPPDSSHMPPPPPPSGGTGTGTVTPTPSGHVFKKPVLRERSGAGRGFVPPSVPITDAYGNPTGGGGGGNGGTGGNQS